MLPELVHLDPKKAVGILARAALFLQSEGTNPAAMPFEPAEESLRQAILKRASFEVGDTTSHNDAMLDWLDNQIEETSSPVDERAALDRLSADAALPSDIYSVTFDDQFKAAEDFTQFNDRPQVLECVRNPDIQEDFGPEGGDKAPSFVSIFGKWHGSKIERDHYLLVAVCERFTLNFLVKHYWRIYPADVVLYPMANLTDALAKFASIFGTEFRLNDFNGRFLYQKSFPIGTKEITFDNYLPNIGPREFGLAVCVFRQENGYFRAAIGIGVNISKYKRSVLRHDRSADRVHKLL